MEFCYKMPRGISHGGLHGIYKAIICDPIGNSTRSHGIKLVPCEITWDSPWDGDI